VDNRKTFLVSFLVNVVSLRSGSPDQTRLKALVKATTEEEARKRFNPIANQLGFSFVLEEVETIDLERMEDFPRSLREFCKRKGFDLVVSASSPAGITPNCS